MGHRERPISTTKVDLALVSGEALWPSLHGGRLRTAGLVEGLSCRFRLAVVAPREGPPPEGVVHEALPPAAPLGRIEGVASVGVPRLGAVALGRLPALGPALSRVQPRIALYSHGYLAAVAPPIGVPVAVDFPDVELRRQASLARRGPVRHRALAAWEAAKARRWEPRAARRAAVVAAVTEDDVALLGSSGALAVHVPNGSSAAPVGPSPVTGPVAFVAGFGHPPNVDAARWLVADVWPRVRAVAPGLRLQLAGRDAAIAVPGPMLGDAIDVVSDPVSIEDTYRSAALVLAPVRRGGGAQLKVTEALARGRVVVATPFSAAAAPATGGAGVVEADGAEETAAAIVRLCRDVDERRRREQVLAERRPVPTWEVACRPLADALDAVLATT